MYAQCTPFYVITADNHTLSTKPHPLLNMKHILFLLLLIVGANVQGQIEFGVKAGLSSTELTTKDLLASGKDKTLKVTLQDAKYGYHFGLYTRVKLLNMYLEPALLFNSSQVDYSIQEGVFDTGVVETLKSERYQRIDVPVLFGIKTGFVKIQAGPVAHIQLNNTSELTNVKGYKQKIKDAKYGYQVGIGLEVYKIGVELNYEGNFSGYADSIVIDGDPYRFDKSPSRLVASVLYKF